MLSVRDLALETIREFRMLAPGDRVAVACSGGADSTALLFLLYELAGELGCVLSVAHLNHGLRGAESDADEAFVRRLAERLNLPCAVERADVDKLARSTKTNQEATGRKLRLRFFHSLTEMPSDSPGVVTHVALAHTADDQAETVLHRLVRGAGTRGLSGILPVVNNTIIRPALRVRRADLREWLAGKGETWREDSSNQGLHFTRNRIRHQALPLLEEINSGIVETLAHTAELSRVEESFWEEYLKPLRESWVRFADDQAMIDLNHLRQMHPAVAFRVLRWAVVNLAPTTSINLDHTRGLLRWALQGQSGTRMALPHGLEAEKEFQHLILRRGANTRGMRVGYEYPLQVPGVVNVKEAGVTFQFELVPVGTAGPRYNEKGGVLLDGKVAEFPLLLRNWRAGDAYQPEGHRSRKKLQDLFQRQRVPVHQRPDWPILVSGQRIIWARKLAPAAGCTANAGSSHAVIIRELRG
jgi:tRNA(Ile)-lysidine synthase